MSQRDRAGLMNLTKKPLQPAAMKGATARELEDRILGPAAAETGNEAESSAIPPVQLPVAESVASPVIQPVISPYTKLKPKKKSQKITWSVKLDPELLERLRRVAEHNRLNMSDIVIEAVELHLPHFPQPPEP